MLYLNESMTLPTSVLERSKHNIFIETGSYDGRTIQQALDAGFGQVISIELSNKYWSISDSRFKDDDRVLVLQGDTIDVLPSVLETLDEPATFWLDAHIQEGVKGKVAAPLMYELEAIGNHHIKTHTIMIDDVRLMGTKIWENKVLLDMVMLTLQKINPAYMIERVDSKVAERDIIFATVEDIQWTQ